MSCADNTIECYVLDNNGFVVISEDKLNTGKFFGEIDGTVLNSLVQNNVFKKIKVYDYQVQYSNYIKYNILSSKIVLLYSVYNF